MIEQPIPIQPVENPILCPPYKEPDQHCDGISPICRHLHMALIRPDVAMGDLLKTQPGSQLFTVFSAPRVKGADQAEGRLLSVMCGTPSCTGRSPCREPCSSDR
jgi:hypothetical protein